MTLVYKQLSAISKRLQFTHISELAAHWNNAPIYVERSLSSFLIYAKWNTAGE